MSSVSRKIVEKDYIVGEFEKLLVCQQCGILFVVQRSYYNWMKKRGTPIKFHNMKCNSEYQKTAFLGEKNPFYGKKHTGKMKEELSEIQRQRYKEYPEIKQRISEKRKGQHNSPETEFKKGQHPSLDTEFKKGHLSLKKGKFTIAGKICELCGGNYRGKSCVIKNRKYCNRKCAGLANAGKSSGTNKNTSIELLVEEQLKRWDLEYDKHIPLCKIGNVDFFLPRHNIIIECDGDYWHNPKYFPETAQNDATKNLVWNFNGYKVFRFWEHEINKSPKKCVNKVLKYIKKVAEWG